MIIITKESRSVVGKIKLKVLILKFEYKMYK